MTVVIAKKFGERIVIMSDTLVSDKNARGPDVIPGCIKSVVLSMTVSVAFAGHIGQAQDAIRKAKSVLFRGHSVNVVLDVLRSSTENCLCDFILACHAPNAQLYKIWEGKVSGDLNECWVGDGHVVRQMEILQQNLIKLPDQEHVCAGEQNFLNAFIELFSRSGVQINPVAGGTPIQLLCSPFGHCFGDIGYGTMTNIKLIDGKGVNLTFLDGQEDGGINSYKMVTVTTNFRGVPVLGIYFPQAPIGYIFAGDMMNAERTNCSIEELQIKLDALGKELGGVWVV